MKKTINKKSIQKDRIESDILTREKFRPIFEDIKELVISTVKGAEKVLRKEIQGVSGRLDRVEVAISEHTRQIKQLDLKIDGVSTELKEEIQGARTELKDEMQGLRTELKEDMHQMEARLSNKIDGHVARLDNHEARISVLESARS